MFLPREPRDRDAVRQLFARIVEEEGQTLLGWREVPHDNGLIGDSAKATQPLFEQVFIGAAAGLRGQAFERKLCVIRKRLEHAADRLEIGALSRRLFYIVSLSANTLIYKGMLTARQLEPMFPDLSDPTSSRPWRSCTSGSARTPFHPGRSRTHIGIAHNGEINTLRGNINWMRAREVCCRATSSGRISRSCCRSFAKAAATHGNVRQRAGIPRHERAVSASRNSHDDSGAVGRTRRAWTAIEAFYQYHSSLMEPWDGPASIAFTDGTVIGAGARPQRSAPIAGPRHEERPRDHGLGSRRAGHSAR